MQFKLQPQSPMNSIAIANSKAAVLLLLFAAFWLSEFVKISLVAT